MVLICNQNLSYQVLFHEEERYQKLRVHQRTPILKVTFKILTKCSDIFFLRRLNNITGIQLGPDDFEWPKIGIISTISSPFQKFKEDSCRFCKYHTFIAASQVSII